MDAATKKAVRKRAKENCEYCGLPQSATPLVSHHIEHIQAKQHHGSDELDNLALACDRCNAYKGPNLTTISIKTGEIVELFHPRKHTWEDHFEESEGVIHGLTETGNATVELLQMNNLSRVELRKLADESDI